VTASGGLLSLAGNSHIPDIRKYSKLYYTLSKKAKYSLFLPCEQPPKSAIFSRDQLLVVLLLLIAAYTQQQTFLFFQNRSAFCLKQ
jgi:hypothetical protein